MDAYKNLADRLSSFHSDHKYTDFTIVCGDRRWRVHRLVLALHSDVLAKASSGEFKEGIERKIDLCDDHPACINAIICYMYKLDYSEDSGEKLAPAAFHVHVCILADKYNIPDLKTMATKKFEAAARGQTHTAEFAEAASIAYAASSATTALCKVIIALSVEEKPLGGMNGQQSQLRAVMKVTPELATDYAEALEARPVGKEDSGEKRYRCPSCQKQMILEMPPTMPDFMYYCCMCRAGMTNRAWQNHLVG